MWGWLGLPAVVRVAARCNQVQVIVAARCSQVGVAACCKQVMVAE